MTVCPREPSTWRVFWLGRWRRTLSAFFSQVDIGEYFSRGLAGATFRISGTRLQLSVRGHFGPSTIGKFRNIDENFIGLGLRIIP